MRAGWILLEIRHKQYEVNVDEVGADSIRPRKSQQHKKVTFVGTVLCAYFFYCAHLTRTARAAV